MRRWTLLGVAGGIFFIASCAHKIIPEPVGYTAAKFWKDQKTRRTLLKQASAKLSLSYRDPKQGFTGKGQGVWSLPQKGRLEVRDPFGRLQYVVVAGPKAFSAFYPGDGTWFKDDESGRGYFKYFIGVDQSFGEMTGWLLGILPDSAAESFDSWSWIPREGVYEGKLRAAGGAMAIGIDPNTSAMVWARTDRGGGFSVEYSGFSPCCGGATLNVKSDSTALARSVRLESSRTGQAIESDWQDIDPLKKSPDAASFEFTPPSGAKLTPLPKPAKAS